MKNVKYCFVAAEVAAILGVVMFLFCADMNKVLNEVLVLLLTLWAVTMQREQQAISTDEKDEEE